MTWFNPGDLFTCPDVYGPSGRIAFGIVLERGKSLVIRGDGVAISFTTQLSRIPDAAALVRDGEAGIPADIRLALEAVAIALNIQHRDE